MMLVFIDLRSWNNKDFFMTIMGRTGALDSFKLNGDGTIINSSDFTQIPGSNWWVARFNMTAQIAPKTFNILKNTKDIFHLGILHGGASNGGNYGYFSNYNG